MNVLEVILNYAKLWTQYRAFQKLRNFKFKTEQDSLSKYWAFTYLNFKETKWLMLIRFSVPSINAAQAYRMSLGKAEITLAKIT